MGKEEDVGCLKLEDVSSLEVDEGEEGCHVHARPGRAPPARPEWEGWTLRRWARGGLDDDDDDDDG